MVHQSHEDEKNSSEFFEKLRLIRAEAGEGSIRILRKQSSRRTLQVLLLPALPFGNGSLPKSVIKRIE
jgi:hypothetical protein